MGNFCCKPNSFREIATRNPKSELSKKESKILFSQLLNGVNRRDFRQFIVLHLDILEIVRMTSVCKLVNDLIFSKGEFTFNFSNFEKHLK